MQQYNPVEHPEWWSLFGEDADRADFYNQIRRLNSTHAFISCTFHDVAGSIPGRGPPFLRIQGSSIYHNIGPLFPEDGVQPGFSQIYFYDNQDQMDLRAQQFDLDLPLHLIGTVTNGLWRTNPFAQVFKRVGERVAQMNERGQRIQDLHIHFQADQIADLRQIAPLGRDPCVYAAPAPGEHMAGILLSGPDGTYCFVQGTLVLQPGAELPSTRANDIVMPVVANPNGYPLHRVSPLHPYFFTWAYLLLFPFGEPGWGLHDKTAGTGSTTLTMRKFWRFRLQQRHAESTRLLNAGRLMQQFIIDVALTILIEELKFARLNQETLRSDLYQNVVNAAEADPHAQGATIGKCVVLPSSFTGSPRHLSQLYQDVLAIVCAQGRPDLHHHDVQPQLA